MIGKFSQKLIGFDCVDRQKDGWSDVKVTFSIIQSVEEGNALIYSIANPSTWFLSLDLPEEEEKKGSKYQSLHFWMK